MFNINWRIDEEIISKFDKKNKETITNLLENIQKSEDIKGNTILKMLKNVRIHVNSCPYCNVVGINILPVGGNWEFNDFCPHCMEPSPNMKIWHSLSNAEDLLLGSDYILSGEDIPEVEYWYRTILEQSIVIIATGVEMFFRNIFAIIMNLRYVKTEKSLYQRFYVEGKNEFINIGKAKKKINDDLDVNIKDILGDDNYKKLNLLMLKRNAIVHNSGFVDNSFQSQCGIPCELKDQIPLDKDEVKEYLKIVKDFVDSINNNFEIEVKSNVIQELNRNLPNILM